MITQSVRVAYCTWLLGAGVSLAIGSSGIHAEETERFDLGDFELESGEVIEDAYLTYVTHGELNDARDNAILVLPSLNL